MRWKYIHIDTRQYMMLSGWKLYIYGNTVRDSEWLKSLLYDIVHRYDITCKIATEDIIRRNTHLPIPWGSMVMYIPPFVFSCSVLSELIDDINGALRAYDRKGVIPGAASINDRIHYRYDMDIPVVASKGVTYEEYFSHYRGEYGEYNIAHNEDIIKHSLTL